MLNLAADIKAFVLMAKNDFRCVPCYLGPPVSAAEGRLRVTRFRVEKRGVQMVMIDEGFPADEMNGFG